MNKSFLFTSKNSYFPLTFAFWSAWLLSLSYKTTEQEYSTWVRERAVHWLDLLNEYTFTERVSVFSLTQSDYVWTGAIDKSHSWKRIWLNKEKRVEHLSHSIHHESSSDWLQELCVELIKCSKTMILLHYYILESLISFADMQIIIKDLFRTWTNVLKG